jgi:hypothetical protein
MLDYVDKRTLLEFAKKSDAHRNGNKYSTSNLTFKVLLLHIHVYVI